MLRPPTCHRASFDSFLEDVDYLAALERSDGITRRQYQKDAAKIAEVQRGILATSQNTEPYDVFISYKELDADGNRTRDSILAQEVYYRLTEKGWRVFFSRISLEDVPGTQYEPYIFAALNSAKVMIVVGTSAENLNAVWVKNEWSRYLSLMRKDRSKLLIPCYRDMDPYDLPEQLSVLMSYDMGKIGFIQDLIRGVDKVLAADKPKETAAPAPTPMQERVIVQQQGGGPNVTAMLKRGQQALEDGEWDKAQAFFDQVLNMDAENAEAFLGLFLAGEKCADENVYIERACAKKGEDEFLYIPVAQDRINEVVYKYKIESYLTVFDLRKLFEYDCGYCSRQKAQKIATEKEKQAFLSNRELNRAFRYAKGEAAERLNEFKTQLFARLDRNVEQAKEQENTAREAKLAAYEDFLTKAEKTAQEMNVQAQKQKQESYMEICQRIETATKLTAFYSLKSELEQRFSGYKDCAEQIKYCDERIAALEKKAQEEAERQRIIEEKRRKAVAEEAERQRMLAEKAAMEAAKKRKKAIAIITWIGIACVAFVVVLIKVIIPNANYNKALTLKDSGDYYEAVVTLSSLGNYKDSYAIMNEIVHSKEWMKVCPVGWPIFFGSYEQDNNVANGKESIEWMVLEKNNNRILVISKKALDCQPYNNSYSSVTWETSSLRAWLNESFINTAFSSEELAMIPRRTVSADENPIYKTSPGHSTMDQIFLLSCLDATKYFSFNGDRQCQGTAYCYARGASKASNEYCCWWLRSPGNYSFTAATINNDGYIDSFGSTLGVTDSTVAVRPALWIDLG